MAGARQRDRARLLAAKEESRTTREADTAASITALQGLVAPLCKVLAVDLNVTGDTPFSVVAATRYFIRRIVAVGLTGTAATAVLDIRTATGGGGTAIVSGQSLAALGSAVEVLELTPGLTDALLVGTLYARVTTPEGATGTVDLFVFGDVLD